MDDRHQWVAVQTLLTTATEGEWGTIADVIVAKAATELLQMWEIHHHEQPIHRLMSEDLMPAIEGLKTLAKDITQAITPVATTPGGMKLKLAYMVWANTPKFKPIHVYEVLDAPDTPADHIAIMLGYDNGTYAYIPKETDILEALKRDVILLNQGENKESDNITFAWESLYLESLGYDLDVIYPQE